MNSPANSGQTQAKRNKKGQFTLGISGNPIGPKPGYKQMGSLIKDALKELATGSEDKTWADMIIKRLIMNAVAGKEKSIEIILDRVDGKVKDEFKGEVTEFVAHNETNDGALGDIVDDFIAHFREKLNEQNKKPEKVTPLKAILQPSFHPHRN